MCCPGAGTVGRLTPARPDGKIVASLVYPEFFAVEPHHRLLDLACGAGPQLALYARRVERAVGVDIQAERLALAAELLGRLRVGSAHLVRADVTALPLPDRAFDRAIAIDVIEHLDEPTRLLAEAHPVLVESGRLLVTVPAFYDTLRHGRLGRLVARMKGRGRYFSGQMSYDDHRPPLPLPEWEAMFERSGFRVGRSAATTLFPPLHRYGVPRLWFAVTPLRRGLSRLGAIQVLRGLGQAVMFDLRRV